MQVHAGADVSLCASVSLGLGALAVVSLAGGAWIAHRWARQLFEEIGDAWWPPDG